MEGQWAENLRTIEGSIMHTRAHDEKQRERRGDTLVLRDLQVFSPTLGVSGKCDVVEFHADPDGVTLRGENGLWLPYPVEYKRGSPKSHDADRLQLCCQAMCLEEMLCCCVPEGSLFYDETRRRDVVEFTAELRGKVRSMLSEMHHLAERGSTPRVKPSKSCNACSIKDICLPAMLRGRSGAAFIKNSMEEEV